MRLCMSDAELTSTPGPTGGKGGGGIPIAPLDDGGIQVTKSAIEEKGNEYKPNAQSGRNRMSTTYFGTPKRAGRLEARWWSRQ